MEIRLQKYLADAGVASRRACEKIISSGLIEVNGNQITQMGVKIDPDKDIIKYKGEVIIPKTNFTYIMLHKPEGYVTTVKDQFNRATVVDLLDEFKERLFPVGRLDYDTSGLLILTNDGDLTYKLTHPKHKVEKVYLAKLIGHPTEENLRDFRSGLLIDDYKTSMAKIKVTKKDEKFSWAEIIIIEGKNRQVRKMCDKIGCPVSALKRIATGQLKLGQLEKGAYRPLLTWEIEYLKSL